MVALFFALALSLSYSHGLAYGGTGVGGVLAVYIRQS